MERKTIRQQMQELFIDHGPNGIDDDVLVLLGKYRELRGWSSLVMERHRQETMQENMMHQKHFADWCYRSPEGTKLLPCPCKTCIISAARSP